MVELQDDDYRAQVDQASAAVEAARAAIETTVSASASMQEARIAQGALPVSIKQKAQIAAAEAGREASKCGLGFAPTPSVSAKRVCIQTHSATATEGGSRGWRTTSA